MQTFPSMLSEHRNKNDKLDHTEDSNTQKSNSSCREIEPKNSNKEKNKSVADVLSRIDPKEKIPKEHQIETAKRKKVS